MNFVKPYSDVRTIFIYPDYGCVLVCRQFQESIGNDFAMGTFS